MKYSKSEQAWHLRLNGHIEESARISSEIRAELNLPSFSDLKDMQNLFSAANAEKNSVVTDWLLLNISFLRHEGDLAKARVSMQQLEKNLAQFEIAFPFQLYFQRALNFFADSEYGLALEDFMAATNKSKSDYQKIFSLGNTLFCLEYLGLPLKSAKRELEKEIDLYAETHKDLTLITSMKQQLSAFKLRWRFRKGKFREIFTEEVQHQAFWYQIFVSELPYHACHQYDSEKNREGFYKQNPSFYLKSYRVRTLEGIFHTMDQQSFKIGELCDRVYLWTWRWLKNPETFSFDKVIQLFQDLEWNEFASKLGSDDYQQVRNSLKWLSFFNPSSLKTLQKFLGKICPVHVREDEIYKLEEMVVDCLTYRRDCKMDQADDLLQLIKSHPLFAIEDLYFKELLIESNSVNGRSPISGLHLRILNTLKKNEQIFARRPGLVVDIDHFRVTWDEGSQGVTSESMTRAFEILRLKQNLSCAEFSNYCFGIRRYEQEIHLPKIFNLLGRMRMCAPNELKIGVKEGFVVAIGSWDGVSFMHSQSQNLSLSETLDWKSTVRKKSNSKIKDRSLQKKQAHRSRLLTNVLLGKSEITRKDLEKMMELSRSSVNRILEAWVEQGFLIKVGKAKSTKYLVQVKGTAE